MIFQYRIVILRYKDDDYRKYQDGKLYDIICLKDFKP
jgi:hypothetical protein